MRSEDVNGYLKAAAGVDFSAKDFRTWKRDRPGRRRARRDAGAAGEVWSRSQDREAVKGVAAFLGNTPAVCRRSYIDPRVFDRYRDGSTIAATLRQAGSLDEAYLPSAQRRIERAVIRLISAT